MYEASLAETTVSVASPVVMPVQLVITCVRSRLSASAPSSAPGTTIAPHGAGLDELIATATNVTVVGRLRVALGYLPT